VAKLDSPEHGLDAELERQASGFDLEIVGGNAVALLLSGNTWEVAMKVHVFGVSADHELWHTVLDSSQSFGDLDAQAGRPWKKTVVDAACAADKDGNLHVLVVTDDDGGRLWHTVRAQNGFWTPTQPNGTSFGDVGDVVSGESGKFRAVAAATDGLDLHVLAATDNKKLWRTIRRPRSGVPIHEGGVWGPFKEVDKQGEAKGRLFLLLESASSVK
jgi:hypothetical protein